MPKFLPGLSHRIVKTVKSKEAMEKLSGAMALVTLCFTTNDDCINVMVHKMQGPTSGVTASVPGFIINGKPVDGIQGKVASELKMEALMAFDRVKQKFGLKWNRKYVVYEKTIEEIPDAQHVSGLGAQPVGQGAVNSSVSQ